MAVSMKSSEIISISAKRKLKIEYFYTFSGIDMYKCYDLDGTACGFIGRVACTKYGPLCPDMNTARVRALCIQDAMKRTR